MKISVVGTEGVGSLFRRIIKKESELVELDDIYCVNYDEVVEDAMVKDWGRKNSDYYYRNNSGLVKKLKKSSKTNKYLRFDYEKVEL